MKRFIAGMLLILMLLILPGCKEDTVLGRVVACGGRPQFFELLCADGSSAGFVITEETILAWEDLSAFETANDGADAWDVFDCNMRVRVTPGQAAPCPDKAMDDCVKSWHYAQRVVVEEVLEDYFTVAAKPVIYLYPEKELPVEVSLKYSGKLTCTYPQSDGFWQVTAHPDGTLSDQTGRQYRYLYWEGITHAQYDFAQGFCVPGDQTAAFLEDALHKLGLTDLETNDFIVYWLPLMQDNPYNLISFQHEAYEAHAQLAVSPAPDTVIRVFMAYQPLQTPVEIAPQLLTAPEREGFTVIEWGGTQIHSAQTR